MHVSSPVSLLPRLPGRSGNETNRQINQILMWYPRGTVGPYFALLIYCHKLYGGGSGSGSGDFLPPMEGGGEGKDQTPQVQGEGKKWTGFDPTGLERAAKAA